MTGICSSDGKEDVENGCVFDGDWIMVRFLPIGQILFDPYHLTKEIRSVRRASNKPLVVYLGNGFCNFSHQIRNNFKR